MKKVLVVDDENDAAELLSFNLRVAGFEVITAANGQEALCKARAFMLGLILLDVMLPEIDGFEVCRLLRQDPLTCEIPIIMLTAMLSEISRLVGLESGADGSCKAVGSFAARHLRHSAPQALLGTLGTLGT